MPFGFPSEKAFSFAGIPTEVGKSHLSTFEPRQHAGCTMNDKGRCRSHPNIARRRGPDPALSSAKLGFERATLELNRKRPGRIRRCEEISLGPGRFGLSREKEAAGAAR
jgi:hypothetical protein